LENFELEIIYQDQNYVVVNKPAWLLVHKTPGDKDTNNLLKILRNHLNAYVWPVNRLDKQVSGLVVFATSAEMVSPLQNIWHEQVKKKYLGVSSKLIPESGEFAFPLKDDNGIEKEARTSFRPLAILGQATLLEIEIFTGRNHQIRRHFSRRCQHLIGDRKYGKKIVNDYYRDHFGLDRIFLHCHHLSFKHPISKEIITLKADLPNSLKNVLTKMGYDCQKLTDLL
jgi:tRNA pseudouridine65 synthase